MRQLLAPILEKFPVYLAEVRMFFRKHPTFCVGVMMYSVNISLYQLMFPFLCTQLAKTEDPTQQEEIAQAVHLLLSFGRYCKL